MKKILLILTALLSFCLAANIASAYPTVTLYEDHVANAQTVSIAGAYTGGVYAGNYILSVDGKLISGYCVEWALAIGSPGTTYELVPISDYSGDARIGYAAAAWILSQGYPKGAYTAAEAQVAVWELTWDYVKGNKTFSLTSDNFRLTSPDPLTSTFAADVLAIYTAALGANFDPSGYVIAHSPPGSDVAYPQDYVIPNPVPLPGAVLLLGAGLARLVAYARRRKDI